MYTKNGIRIIKVDNPSGGVRQAEQLLSSVVNQDTILFLSGGKTPQELYQSIVQKNEIIPGAIALVDERYGKKYHPNSNEYMISNTRLTSYLESKVIPFYPILEDKNFEETTQDYEKTVELLFETYQNKVAIMGIGTDGHTASLPAGIKNSESGIENKSLVTGINNFPGEFKQRITLTFNALSQMDQLIVLVFGQEKQSAIKNMFTEGSLDELPARFFVQSGIAEKTLLITDQTI